MRSTSISIVFTEYQLLQVESICYKYDFDKSDLVVANEKRINHRLINRDLFDQIYFLPTIYPNGSIKKLSFAYIEEYQQILESKLDKTSEYDIIIGAADENTAMAIIKDYLNTGKYWSIEDGIGNYRRFGFTHDLKINLKKFLFNGLYNKKIEILAQKGGGQKSKSFRIDPELSINKGRHKNLAPIIRAYLSDHTNFYSNQINIEKQYRRVIVVDKKIENTNISSCDSTPILIKKHPKYLDKGDGFSVQNLPIEVLPIIFRDIEKIIYDSYFCSSILNVLSIYNNLKVQLSFNIDERYKNRSVLELIEKVKGKYRDRIALDYE